jgi:hypothetical protein
MGIIINFTAETIDFPPVWLFPVRISNVTETAINFYGDSINMLVDPEVNTIYGAIDRMMVR